MLTRIAKCGMLLPFSPSNNYYNAATLPAIDVSNFTYATVQFKDPTGVEHYYKPTMGRNSSTSFITNALSNTSFGVAVGSGNTEPTEEDYSLESQVTGLTGSISVVDTLNSEDFSFKHSLVVTLTNPGSEDVIIKEIGYFGSSGTSETRGGVVGQNLNARGCLIDRTVLELPVTVPAGESAAISYDFIYPILDPEPEPEPDPEPEPGE